tara:strand:+ start:291 stop:482 length:192 start_codon:yes stop_codon:yes gene_type:complete
MKKVFVLPKGTQEEINKFKETLDKNEVVVFGGELKVYVVKDKEVFQVTNDLKKVGDINVKDKV